MLKQPRSTQRHKPMVRNDEQALTNDNRRTGHPLLPLRLPADHCPAQECRLAGEPQAGGTGPAAGGAESAGRAAQERPAVAERRVMCVRLRPERGNHVPAYDFVHIRNRNGRPVRLLTVIDEYTRECLAIRAGRSIQTSDVIETLARLMMGKEMPVRIRSDNGPEFTVRAVREWLG